MALITQLSKADAMIGRLDMYSNHIPNIDLFIKMHILKEATQSTKIEGTQTNMEDALLSSDEIPVDKRDDWAEVQNYIKAMDAAIASLEKLPLSTRLLREVHRILMQGVRGEHKQPGEFRRSQNWIGGVSISDAIFVPPVWTEVADLMSDIEMFIHNPVAPLPDLIKIAIIHYQFETIHPFNDGNGRVGRLLITLYLVSVGLLKRPVLYLSDFLEQHRNEYFRRIMETRQNNDMKGWLTFFLNGIITTVEKSVTTFDNILLLEKDYEHRIQSLGSRTSNALALLNNLYQNPIIDAAGAASALNIAPASAYSLLSKMEQVGILKEFTGSKRGKKYMLYEYLNLYMTK